MSDLVFQALAWHAEDAAPVEDDDDAGEGVQLKYYVKAFGRALDGRSVAITITGFTPHFFIKVPSAWTTRHLTQLRTFLMESPRVYRSVRAEIKQLKLVRKKDVVGFTNHEEFQFVRVTVHSHRAQRSLVKVFSEPIRLGGAAAAALFPVYESNIEPFIKLIHAADLDPCGWVRVPRGKWLQGGGAPLESTCDVDARVPWQALEKAVDMEGKCAPFRVACFDIECSSSHGDFPQAAKDYKRLASQLYDLYASELKALDKARVCAALRECTLFALGMEPSCAYMDRVDTVHLARPCTEAHRQLALGMVEDMYDTLAVFGRGGSREDAVAALNAGWSSGGRFPKVLGDAIIQIGTTVHTYGERECTSRHIVTLGTCAPVRGGEVELVQAEDEADLLLAWRDHMARVDPDLVSGYNVFGFDMAYMHDRAKELGVAGEFLKLGRLADRACAFKETKLSSSALGDNLLRFIQMDGRVLMDVMKVVQRDHKLDSYKLDAVAQHFTGEKKDDVTPQDIFRLQKGSADDRCVIATYCVQDCELCNRLIIKLDLLAGNMGMSNVCLVPLSYIFMRGQGIKIFSLVLKQCREDGFLVPVIKMGQLAGGGEDDDQEGYEGAIVLEPQEGIYIDDPVSVLDYASLYPSSMISENLSHDTLVMDPAYDNLPGVEYEEVTYDVYDEARRVVGKRTCRFAQGRQGLLPRILTKLLAARKATRRRMAAEQQHLTEFQMAVLDGLQNAYKVTANSLYGQCGARTSPIHLKDIAACTTATGRKMILKAKGFLEEQYSARVVYGDSVAGYTPVFVRTPQHGVCLETVQTVAALYGGGGWLPTRDGKQALELRADLEIWSDEGWTSAHRLICHALAPGKRMLRVVTHTGVVDVTDDHSLLLPDGHTVVKPRDLREGRRILHSRLPDLLGDGGQLNPTEAQIMGYFLARGDITPDGRWQVADERMATLVMYRNKCCKAYPELRWRLHEYATVLQPEGDGVDVLVQYYRTFLGSTEPNTFRVPNHVLCAPQQVRKAFWLGFSDAGGRISSGDDLCSASLFALCDSLGMAVRVSRGGDALSYDVLVNGDVPADGQQDDGVQSVTDVPEPPRLVYDFTTANHKFAAGVGRIVVHNTDSLFVIFPDDVMPPEQRALEGHHKGRAKLMPSIATATAASRAFKPLLKAPHDLEYEKSFWPFILLSKKRYVGNLYEQDDVRFQRKSMGIAIKRRDSAHIVKKIYGGVLDIILNQHDLPGSIAFLRERLEELISGRCPLEDLIITKSLRSDYKNPAQIAHKVLAERMGSRDPGNRPQVNDRIPYLYVKQQGAAKMLQGERIEHPDYVVAHNLPIDYEFYITNQVMRPVLQLYACVIDQLQAGTADVYRRAYEEIVAAGGDPKKAKDKVGEMKEKALQKQLFDPVFVRLENLRSGAQDIRAFFKSRVGV
jgi:DNA polymerase elongation subunit (family B)